jgi:hypothetical protein
MDDLEPLSFSRCLYSVCKVKHGSERMSLLCTLETKKHPDITVAFVVEHD